MTVGARLVGHLAGPAERRPLTEVGRGVGVNDSVGVLTQVVDSSTLSVPVNFFGSPPGVGHTLQNREPRHNLNPGPRLGLS